MTAAAGVLTGLAKLKRQDSARSQQHHPTAATSAGLTQEAAHRKRKRRTDVVVVRGRLRLYSASGFFLLLGLVILAAGIGMATLGYWPHRGMKQSTRTPTGGGSRTGTAGGIETSVTDDVNGVTMANSSSGRDMRDEASKQTGGMLTRFLQQHRHSERMKMLGPFTMGIGIFIFICANAILHENRDRETKIIHMRDMYSTVIDIHRLRQREQKHHQRKASYARDVADLRVLGAENASALRQASSSLLTFSSCTGRGGSTEDEEVLLGEGEAYRYREQSRLDCGLAGLLAPLYKDRSFCGPGLGLVHSDSAHHQWTMTGDGEQGGHHARSIVSSSISAFTLPVIKLNNCVIDEPEMEAITEEHQGGHGIDQAGSQLLDSMESLAIPVASVSKASKPPRLHRSNSAFSPSNPTSISSSSLSPAPSSTSGCWLFPGTVRSDFGSNSSLHILSSHSKSLDLERRPSVLSVHSEQRKHPSWPRLDRSNSSRSNSGSQGSSKGYTRLEDREEQGERPTDASPSVPAKSDYSKREKLLMISRSHNNLRCENEEFTSSTLKRGSSETRF